ncbi:MAG: hypothetical protein ACI9XC_000712 [Gammaproteobacteria bacterium]|jgi:hypothetical protein
MVMNYKYIISLFLIVSISGCGKSLNLQVDTAVPTPIASQLPLVVGVYYNDNFKNFIFKESTDAREDWTIDNRSSRILLFDDILPSMFKTVNSVNNVTSSDSLVDGILEPEVIEMQVALPEETHSDMFEAWIKYGIKLYSPSGKIISEWQITGYGKTHTAMFKNKEKGLTTAINMALRDIGAKMVLDFPRAPGIKNWLSTKIDCAQYSNIC